MASAVKKAPTAAGSASPRISDNITSRINSAGKSCPRTSKSIAAFMQTP
jgi:hypothetical protein